MEAVFVAGLAVWVVVALLAVAGIAIVVVLAPPIVPLFVLAVVLYSNLHDE